MPMFTSLRTASGRVGNGGFCPCNPGVHAKAAREGLAVRLPLTTGLIGSNQFPLSLDTTDFVRK
jgi:hypothetical protein